MHFHGAGIAAGAGMEVEALVRMRCMQLLVACNAELVLVAGTQWLGGHSLAWQFVAAYRRWLGGGTLFAM